MKILISILLALIPIYSWIGQYFFSKKDKLLNSFKKHWTCYCWDWIFVIINIFFVYSIEFANIIYVFLLVSILINLLSHHIWWKRNKIRKEKGHFFHIKTNKLNKAWIIHLIFSVIQLTILLSIVFLKPIFPFILIEFLFIIIFWIFIILGSYKIHWKIETIDLIAFLLLLTIIFYRLFDILPNQY
jgi:hypothetical protein